MSELCSPLTSWLGEIPLAKVKPTPNGPAKVGSCRGEVCNRCLYEIFVRHSSSTFGFCVLSPFSTGLESYVAHPAERRQLILRTQWVYD
jgi:hypothetical protein